MKKYLISLLAFSFLSLALPGAVLASTLSLSPATGTFNRSCPFALDIAVNTAGAQTDGTDAILFYDASRFTAQSITNGAIYPDFPGNNIDSASGKITISGLASVSTPFSGTGILATINFIVTDTSSTGATQITFDFDPNNKAKTTDSNVVERGTVVDTLNSVVNGNYTIGTGTCGSVVSPVPKLPQGAVSTPAAQPKTIDQLVDRTGKGPGTPQLTFTLAIIGSVLTVLGILGLALL
ncbi:MAG: cohesin domain-containing protein [Candidatus Daviesbacteria bacterium]|nr:cohesin domain-containing protein [Candidatus Daviesbacteria bacterium]